MLTDFNYLIPKVGTKFRHIVHLLGMASTPPQHGIQPIPIKNPENIQTDPPFGEYSGREEDFNKAIRGRLEDENQ